jgi:hypothetical protein
MDSNKRLQEDLYRIAGQAGVDFRSVNPKSGAALEWEYQAQEVVLKKTAYVASNLEYAIIDLFKLYTNEDFEYLCKYPEKYGPIAIGNKLADIDKVIMMGIPERPAALLKKHAFREVTKDYDENEVLGVISDFDIMPKEEGEEEENKGPGE